MTRLLFAFCILPLALFAQGLRSPAFFGSANAAADSGTDWLYPSDDTGAAGWTVSAPSQQTLNPAQLQLARNIATGTNTLQDSGFIVYQGRLVKGWGIYTQLYDVRSCTKSFVSTLAGLAIDDGLMGTNMYATNFGHGLNFARPPESNTNSLWNQHITIGQLLSQSAGFNCLPPNTNIVYQPGTEWLYTDDGYDWLAETITLTNSEDLFIILSNNVMREIGVQGSQFTWRPHNARSHTISGISNREGSAGLVMDVDALARYGYLFLRNGSWHNTNQIVSSGWVSASHQSVVDTLNQRPGLFYDIDYATNHFGYGWWNNADAGEPGSFTNAPNDIFMAVGAEDNLVVVWPSQHLLLARASSNALHNPETTRYGRLRPIVEAISAATNPPVYVATNAVFDGVNDYMRLTSSGPSGLTENKLFTFACWAKRETNDNSGTEYLFSIGNSAGNERWGVRFGTNRVQVVSLNSAGTTLLNIFGNSSITTNSGWVHIYCVGDQATQSSIKIFVNGVEETLTTVTYVDGTPDTVSTSARYTVGADAAAGRKFNGAIAELFWDDRNMDETTVYTLTSDPAWPLFYYNGNPVDLYFDGSAPSGFQPVFYFKGQGNSFNTNSGSGGDMTVTGSLGTTTGPP